MRIAPAIGMKKNSWRRSERPGMMLPMSVWSKILARAGRAFDLPEDDGALAPLGCAPDPGDVGFTIAVIGLAAKMARVDGAAGADEREAARAVFQPPPGEGAAFDRVFSLAQETVSGFEGYARQIGRRYRARPCLLEDVLDGLFHIAAADGDVTRQELDYLRAVADRFGFSEIEFRRIQANNLGPDPDDPYAALGIDPGATLEEARRAWRRLAAENHPDRVAARGASPALVRIAQDKTAAINDAFARIRAEWEAPEVEGARRAAQAAGCA